MPQIAANPPNRREDGVDHHRGEPQRRLVEQHEIRPGHQGAPDRQHLLLAARQGPGQLTLACLQHRKQREHLRHQVGDLAGGPGDGADLQILANGHPIEDPAALRHPRQTMAGRGMRRLTGHVVTVEADRSVSRPHRPDDRLQRAALPGAIGAQQRHDLPLPRRAW